MCFAIAGPGSTNLLTGLYDAKLDGSPVVAVSGQVPSKDRGRGAFQDLDLSSVFSDVAVSSQVVLAGSDHAELAALAVKRAIDGRGVAHLVLPDEVQVLGSERGRRPNPLDASPAAGSFRRIIPSSARPISYGRLGARSSSSATAPGPPVRTSNAWLNGSVLPCSRPSKPKD